MSQNDFVGRFDQSKELCFDGNDFLEESFSIDNFLRDHRHNASLEIMRDHLGLYLKTLRLSMIELINKDYEDFVNLSKDLIGLNHGIHSIQVPLGQLREEVLQVKNDLEETITGLHDCLEQRRQIREKKRCLLHLTQVIASIDKLKSILMVDGDEPDKKVLTLDLVERAAVEYNQLQFSMSKCKNYFLPIHKKDAEDIEQVLINVLNALFLECLCDKHVDKLSRCLRIFASLNKAQDLEKLVKTTIISPVLNEIINEAAFSKTSNNVQGNYLKIIEFVDVQLKEILELTTYTNKEPTVKGFNFIINSLWPELERRLELYLSSVFASSDRQLFHTWYSESVAFINQLELRCGNQAAVLELRNHSQYQQFFQKWNLPVYYKVRVQEIAGRLEMVLSQNDQVESDSNCYNFKASSHIIRSLKICWSKDIYISDLGNMFWKLSLQILSRYAIWINDVLKKPESFVPDVKKPDTNESVTQSTIQEQLVKPRLDFLVCLYSDTMKIATEASAFLNSCKDQISTEPTVLEQLDVSLNDSIQLVQQCSPKITASIVKVIVSKSVTHLKQVSDIPRLFRKTNREKPSKPCDYVSQVLLFPKEFYSSKRDAVSDVVLNDWLTLVFSEITLQFYACVSEVLTTAQRTEESLRRLMKVKNSNSDDVKIRQQLVIDVQSYCEGAEAVQVDRTKVEKMQALVQLVESAKEKSEKQ